jgi:voltage-gated potassium channel
MPRFGRWRRRVGTWINRAALAVGLLCVALITDVDLHLASRGGLEVALGLCWCVFAAEFGLRVVDSSESHHARRYLRSAHGIADLIGVVAIPIGFLLGARSPDVWLLGALWVLKLTPASAGLRQLGHVFVAERRPLSTVATLFLIILCLGAIILHKLERGVQPAFDSVSKSLWWAVVTLTTTGYGDVVPQTVPGRIVAGFMMICGIGVFALFAGIIATGFSTESRREDFLRNLDLVRRVPFLRVLSAAGIAELARMLRRLEVPEHTAIYRRDDPGDCMFFVVAGEVEIDVRPRPVTMGTGKFFGEMALLSGRTRNANAVAVRPTTLLMLDAMDFHTLTAHHPELAKAVEAEAHRRHAEGRAAHAHTENDR